MIADWEGAGADVPPERLYSGHEGEVRVVDARESAD